MSHTLDWLRRNSVIATAAAATAAVAYSVFSFVSNDGITHNVSWSDEHGKSLTEVFRSDTDNETDADDDEVRFYVDVPVLQFCLKFVLPVLCSFAGISSGPIL
jgi:hypothetical protein